MQQSRTEKIQLTWPPRHTQYKKKKLWESGRRDIDHVAHRVPNGLYKYSSRFFRPDMPNGWKWIIYFTKVSLTTGDSGQVNDLHLGLPVG